MIGYCVLLLARSNRVETLPGRGQGMQALVVGVVSGFSRSVKREAHAGPLACIGLAQ